MATANAANRKSTAHNVRTWGMEGIEYSLVEWYGMPGYSPSTRGSDYAVDMRSACGTDAEIMVTVSYGKALGELIRRKRRAMGLTQLQLAEDAFADPTKVRRISDVENGLVANPHPKTIDPIITVLKISVAEVEECAERTNAKIDPDLDRAYREARNLIDALAYQFEHANPDASSSELDQFLREKATEWRHLRARLDAIDGLSEEIAQAKRDAAVALSNGQIDEVDATLATLEERFQEQRTLAEVAKQAEIRVTRGDTCLMRDDSEGAINHYLTAARFFQPFSEAEMARTIDEIAHRVYETSLRMLRPRFSIGIRLLEELLVLSVVDSTPEWRIATHYRLGLIYRNAGLHASGGEKDGMLHNALKHSRLAANQSPGICGHSEVVSSMICLSNCLLDIGKQQEWRGTIDESISTLRSARRIALEEVSARSLLSHICNSLGGALLAAARIEDGVPGETENEEALRLFGEAIANAELFSNPDVWGAAQFNRAQLLAFKARQVDCEESERAFLFVQAVSAYHAAVETYPETLFPDRFADSHFELASVLFQFALTVPDDRAEIYMFRAVQSFDIAGAVYADVRPKRWADCQMLSADVIARHAFLDVAETPKHDLEEAIRRFEAALGTYQTDEDGERVEACKRAIAGANEELNRPRTKQRR